MRDGVAPTERSPKADVSGRAGAVAAWNAAVETLNAHLLEMQRSSEVGSGSSSESGSEPEVEPLGAILTGPTPIVSGSVCLERFANWMLVPHASLDRWSCLPGDFASRVHISERFGTVSLCDDDPLTEEQFCLVLTRQFSFVMVLDPRLSHSGFEYSFDPAIVERAWHTLRSRVVLREAEKLDAIDRAVTPFPPIEPHYSVVLRFGQQLLANLQQAAAAASRRAASPHRVPNQNKFSLPALTGEPATGDSHGAAPTRVDLELLTALAHEVRTPLTTIQTLAKLLLRRKTLTDDLRPWVEDIERECSEQIDRFGLIFRAVEFETTPSDRSSVMLTKTPLKTAIDNCIPRWQKQATRRSLKLDVVLPQHMPQVISDPSLLDRILTNTIEHFTSQTPVGSDVRVEISVAGDRLKLQLKSKVTSDRALDDAPESVSSPLKAIGQLLTFQPETGSISLNLAVTKNIFQALGGKLTVRRRPQNGQVVTIFLQLE